MKKQRSSYTIIEGITYREGDKVKAPSFTSLTFTVKLVKDQFVLWCEELPNKAVSLQEMIPYGIVKVRG